MSHSPSTQRPASVQMALILLCLLGGCAAPEPASVSAEPVQNPPIQIGFQLGAPASAGRDDYPDPRPRVQKSTGLLSSEIPERTPYYCLGAGCGATKKE